MSILIKGMEKPKRCGLCPCFHAEHPMHCQAVKAHKDKRIVAPYGAPIPGWCPLVELPPHGRLIDADKLANETFYGATSAPYITYRKFVNAPTVIEAEGTE